MLPSVTRVTVTLALLFAVGGCGWFGGDDGVSVFEVEVGDCVLTPEEITAEVTEVTRVPCAEPHQMEVFSFEKYVAPGTDEAPQDFPGIDAVTAFADGACAGSFGDYVGVDYRDSSLFYTYVLPTARSWNQDDDRSITCFATTTGSPLTDTVRGTKW